MDTIFGIGRAIREYKFNSSVGIGGVMEQNQDGTYNAYNMEGNKSRTVTAAEYEAAGNFRQ